VSAGVLRALGRKPEWTIRQNDKADDDTQTILADIKRFGSKHNVVLVASQTAENEVTVYFKLFAFVLGDTIQLSLSGISEDSYKPMHSEYVSAARAATVEKNRARDIQEFKKRIEDELR